MPACQNGNPGARLPPLALRADLIIYFYQRTNQKVALHHIAFMFRLVRITYRGGDKPVNSWGKAGTMIKRCSNAKEREIPSAGYRAISPAFSPDATKILFTNYPG